MEVEEVYCIQAVGNQYGFPPAGQNFSIEFDKCVSRVIEMGYKNTPSVLKLFYKLDTGQAIICHPSQRGMEMTTRFEIGISECFSWQMLIEVAPCSAQ